MPSNLELSQPAFFFESELGDDVTLKCSATGFDQRLLYWFKFQFGYKIQLISKTPGGGPHLENEFDSSRFISTQTGQEHVLIIKNVSKEDQGTYFCQAGSSYNMEFINGSLLVVKGKRCLMYFFIKPITDISFYNSLFVNLTDPKTKHIFNNVEKGPGVELVQEGNTVNLQCSVISKTKENPTECASEHQVYWYKAASASGPQIIHTTTSKCDVQEKRRCDYHLSKTIHNSSDSGLYSCAVLSCGEILFGERTEVQIKGALSWKVIVLGALTTFSVFVNVILILIKEKKMPVCVQHKGKQRNWNELFSIAVFTKIRQD
uniref:Ig-like domain-containing protein n=1 Tax=Oryzias latipes TaxID=8090 RepID=A0A3B3HAI0_ORYLA